MQDPLDQRCLFDCIFYFAKIILYEQSKEFSICPPPSFAMVWSSTYGTQIHGGENRQHQKHFVTCEIQYSGKTTESENNMLKKP